MIQQKKTFLYILIAALASPVLCMAADAADTKSPHYNMALLCLVGLILILLFVIGMLAGTLRQLSFVVRDKNRKERQQNVVAKTILLLLSLVPAVHSFAAEPVQAEVKAPGFIEGIPAGDFYFLVSIIVFELLIIFALGIFIHQLLNVIRNTPELAAKTQSVAKKSWFWDKFNNAASVEREQDILLDHNYDGIQELDNSLPPWWKYGFYVTIVVAVIYVYRFHISHDGPSQTEEYATEMAQGEEDKAAYLAKSANNVDENSVVMLKDAGELAGGKELFVKSCAACHLADGGGVVGPNLTDDYWLHGGSIKDVFKSIKYGWQDKGMKSWKDDFSPKQIQQLASFIKSLKGTHPAAPKAPQGELYNETVPAAADSVKGKLSVK